MTEAISGITFVDKICGLDLGLDVGLHLALYLNGHISDLKVQKWQEVLMESLYDDCAGEYLNHTA